MFWRRRQQPDPEPAKPYWEQRSWRASAGFLGLVVLVSVVFSLTSRGEADEPPVKVVKAEGPLSGAVGSNGRPPKCETDDGAGDKLPKAPPEDTVWHRLGIAQVPVSASAGPTRTGGRLWWCFAHTPMGAVEAAVIISSKASGSEWREVSRQQLVPGRGRDEFDDAREQAGDVDTGMDAGSAGYYAGFTVTAYRGDTATVKLLIQSPQSSAIKATSSINLRWDRGDWKILPSDGGDLHTELVQDTGNGGFIMWGE